MFLSQTEVFNFLRSVRKMYVSAEEISLKTGLSVISVRKALKRLYKWGEVEMRKGEKNQKYWRAI